MPLNDNGDIIKAVGFVAIYWAYLEDDLRKITEMIKNIPSCSQNIHEYPFSKKIKSIKEELNKLFDAAPSYTSKQEERDRINNTMKLILEVAKDRNEVLHAAIIATHLNGDIQTNRKNNSFKKVTSKKVYKLANEINSLNGHIISLEPYIEKLRSELLK